jgi:3-deoxy-7-phosphoheptulonate synthase
MFTADEMLYPSNYRFLFDLLSYNAVGARSVENQEHRQVASGVECPVGMKNPTGGSTTVMLNSIFAAQQKRYPDQSVRLSLFDSKRDHRI